MGRVAVTKLMHRWQPTNKMVQRNERRPASTRLCDACGCVDEQMHYMKCTIGFFNIARTYAWKRYYEYLNFFSQDETRLRIIWIGLQNWIYLDFNGELPKSNDDNHQQYSKICQAYNHQSTIGWQHFYQCRIFTYWTEFYRSKVPPGPEKEGKIIAFGKALIEANWILTQNVWKSHNDLAHGPNGGY